jgi:hypothetical protein
LRTTTHKRQTLRTGDSQPSFSGRACADRVLAPRCTFHHERPRHSARGHERKPRLMPATMKTEVVGVKETIKALREIDPQFRKDFNKGARAVVAPMVAEAKARYPSLPLSGMARAWTPRQFLNLPLAAIQGARRCEGQDLDAAQCKQRRLCQPRGSFSGAVRNSEQQHAARVQHQGAK